MFRSLLGGALALAYITAATVVYAADVTPATDGVTSIPWGDWLAAILDWATAIIIAVIAWALRQLPAGSYAIIQQLRVEQLLERAVDYGINATKNATWGKKLDIPTTNAVIEIAAEYAATNAPALVQYLDPETLRAKILARIEVTEDVTAEQVGADFVLIK